VGGWQGLGKPRPVKKSNKNNNDNDDDDTVDEEPVVPWVNKVPGCGRVAELGRPRSVKKKKYRKDDDDDDDLGTKALYPGVGGRGWGSLDLYLKKER
jgi:hypothetical protein